MARTMVVLVGDDRENAKSSRYEARGWDARFTQFTPAEWQRSLMIKALVSA